MDLMYIIKISDGLGNQMFQYAFAKKLQIISGKKVYLDVRYINNEDRILRDGKKSIFFKKSDRREYKLDHFKISLPLATEKTLFPWKYLKCENDIDKLILDFSKKHMWPWQYLFESPDNKDNFLVNLHKTPTYIEGYFFDLKYFKDIRDTLQKDFRLQKKIRLSKELKEILIRDNTVSIHIRRGDFLKLNRDISCKGYYDNAVRIMCDYVNTPTWVIFSDDIDWVKENLKITGKKIYVSSLGYEDYEELVIMKNCKNHIIANSTFSFWAAFLNPNEDKVVICPNRWKTEIIPEKWIKI